MNIETADNPENIDEIGIYPNPLSRYLKSIRIRSNSGRTGIMSIYTSDGRLVNKNMRIDGNSLLSLPDLAPGIYVLFFEFGQKKVSKKLIIL